MKIKNPKDKLLTLYILFVHAIEYCFYVHCNLVYNISNNVIYDK
jgi:hypothetical protein